MFRLAIAAAATVVLAGCAMSVNAVPTSSQSSPPPTPEAARPPDEVRPDGSCQPSSQVAANVCVTRELAVWRGVPFTPHVACNSAAMTCQILMDIYAPTGVGPWPLVVIAPGGFMPPDQIVGYTDDFGLAIADRGAVVMAANWRQSQQYGASPAQSVGDVACAVGFARATGPAYGADPARLVLVGHSNGAWPVSEVGLNPTPAPPDAASCNATSGSLRPDAIELMAGAYTAAANELVGSVPANEHIPVVIAQGGMDSADKVTAAGSFQALLAANGWVSKLVEVPTADHFGILSAPANLDAVMALTN